MKIEYINWSTDIFDGFYESALYNNDMLYSICETEAKNYDFIAGGYEKFCNAVAQHCVDCLNDNLQGAKLIKHIDFVRVDSPRYYNFSTDKLVLSVDCDWQGLIEYIKENREDFSKYLYDNFTSCSGFISFVPNNYTDFMADLDDDFERLSQVVIEYYILSNIDLDVYKDDCYDKVYEILWEYIDEMDE